MMRPGASIELIVDGGRVNCPRRGGDVTIEVCLDCVLFEGLERCGHGSEEVLRCAAGVPLRRVRRPAPLKL